MHSRRLACFLLGTWLWGGVLLQWMATRNLRAVDRLLEQPSPPAALQIRALGPEGARALFEYQVAEQNRYWFEAWEVAQLILGSLFFFFLLFGTREDKYSLLLALAMLLMVMLQRLVLTPEITSLGRNLDFLPAGAAGPRLGRFTAFHSSYFGAEYLKWGAGLALCVRLVVGRRRGSSGTDIRKELDLINKAHDRHIDR